MIRTPFSREMLQHPYRQTAEESGTYRQSRFVQIERRVMPFPASGRAGKDK